MNEVKFNVELLKTELPSFDDMIKMRERIRKRKLELMSEVQPQEVPRLWFRALLLIRSKFLLAIHFLLYRRV
jgi:hypothetical protein